MNLMHVARAGLLAGSLLSICSPASSAGMPPDDHAGPGCHGGFGGPPGPPMAFRGPGHDGLQPELFETRPPPYLRDLNLSEDQADKVFAILHAAAPTLRDQAKAAHKAHEALHGLGRAESFDSAHASQLAEAQGKADAQLELTRLRVDHDIYRVLTPEQRTQIEDREREHEACSGEGGHPPRPIP